MLRLNERVGAIPTYRVYDKCSQDSAVSYTGIFDDSSLLIVIFPAPSPPSAVSVSQNGLGSVQVSWKPSSGGPTVTGYIIYYKQDGGKRLSVNTGATATFATITGLNELIPYSITMVATSSTVHSNETAAEMVTVGRLPSNTIGLSGVSLNCVKC